MKPDPITFGQIIAAFVILMIFILVFLRFRRIYKESRKQSRQEENQFNMKYLWMQDRVDVLPVNADNYKILMHHFCDLAQMKYRNREKTQVLFRTFLDKFYSVARYKMEEDELKN